MPTKKKLFLIIPLVLVVLSLVALAYLYFQQSKKEKVGSGYEERVNNLTFEDKPTNSTMVYPAGMEVSDRYLGTDNVSREVFFKFVDSEPGDDSQVILHIYADNAFKSMQEYCTSDNFKEGGLFTCTSEVQFGKEKAGKNTWETVTPNAVHWTVLDSRVLYSMNKNNTLFIISVKGDSPRYMEAVENLRKGFIFDK